MRHQVPFVGERKVVRADDDVAQAKRISGRVIDEVVGDGVAASSWEDTVPSVQSDKVVSRPAGALVSAPMTKTNTPPKAAAKMNSNGAHKSPPLKKTMTPASGITFSDSAGMDWVRINHGRGLRVSVYGNMDNELRREWSRLLNDPESADVKEFEFNFHETSALTLTGLGMLLLFKERKGFGREAIKLCNCNKEVKELLEWSGMEKYFVIQEN